jgi:aconitate hydratase
MNQGAFEARARLETRAGVVGYYRLQALEEQGFDVARMPFSLKILLETLLRNCDGYVIREEDVAKLAGWRPGAEPAEIAFMPARVLLQDFTGVPAVVDLAAMRSAMAHLGGDPKRINPLIPVDLVIDHSVQVDRFGSLFALAYNAEREFERNRERYEFLKWAQRSFHNFRVVPPATGIVHQVNLEYLAKVVQTREEDGETLAYPDTLVGTDSHTTMINGLGVLGWGVGGIEAEAAMLGQPLYMLTPDVVGLKLIGELQEGVTATDLVLRVTQMLREHGVVGKFVEFYGPGLGKLSLPDRATIANMAPEYGATIGFFPVDEETLSYLRGTGRSEELIDLVERYCKEQGLFHTDEMPEPQFTERLELDMSTVEPSLAGPKRPQDRVPLREAKRAFRQALREIYNRDVDAEAAMAPEDERWLSEGGHEGEAYRHPNQEHRSTKGVTVSLDGVQIWLTHGSVVIAAITSCTNTSNPTVMVGAGLLAKKAVERGLDVRPWVKTSLAPGSKVVHRYLEQSGLLPFLEALKFHVVGYGCTTCIGNSGPLPEPIARAIQEGDLVAVAVLSGNRNFEGRINPHTRANYLASPPLVAAYALAGTMDIDFETEPLGYDPNGEPVYLRDIWPTQDEIREIVREALKPELFREQYAHVFEGNERWNAIPVPEGELYEWDPNSTYIQEPPFFEEMSPEPPPLRDIRNARVLVMLGDSVTTDHISPAGAFSKETPAGKYLMELGVEPKEFNSYGSRRGNHEVMMRGTFANIRLRNLLVPDTEGGVTVHFPSGERMSIYDAAMRYKQEGTPLIVIAGKDYGMGSSRDWAAKGPHLLGVKAVLAESFERIHRSNLVGMGILPLQFREGESAKTLGLSGSEIYDIEGIEELEPEKELTVRARSEDGSMKEFVVIAQVYTPIEVEYYQNGGILHSVLRRMLTSG